jgi:membrane-bound lytic murein transglycosylase D
MGIDKFFTYPLALLGSLALIAPATDLDGSRSKKQGEQGAEHATEGTPKLTALHGRTSAESAELRALRMVEGSLFPELGLSDLDLVGAALPTPACDAPDYDLQKSTGPEVAPAGDWLRGLQRPDIAVPRDPKVARYIRYFGGHPKGRETFAAWLRRSGAYRTIVEQALVKRNLPADILAVMFVESGCIPSASSGAGAAGLWQFMPQTARAYGLTVRSDYDERLDIWRSTDAAVAHLADLFSRFESWHLAMAAYNMGYQQLMDRLAETRTEDFFTLSNLPDAIPNETLLYVPKILAVAVILRNLGYFGFDGEESRPAISASRMEVPAHTRLALVARAAGTSLRKLSDLNPQILGEEVPSTGGPSYVYLPNTGAVRAKAMLPRLLEEKNTKTIDLKVTADFDWGRDEFDANWQSRLEQTRPLDKDKTIKGEPTKGETAKGEKLGPLAPPGSKSQESPQQMLKSVKSWGFGEPTVAPLTPKEKVIYHRVRKGDTLSFIAAQYGVTLADVLSANNITTRSPIVLDSKLRIVLPEDQVAQVK